MSRAGRVSNAILAKDLTGPVEALDPLYLELVAQVLRECWSELSSVHSDLLIQENEPQVSILIEAWLRMEGAQRLSDIGVERVVRGSEAVSGNGLRDELRPDLNFYLSERGPSRRFPLIVECKILNNSNKQSIAKYGINGIARFISGDYGWGRREGMMLAYVRDASVLPDTLAKYLADPNMARNYAFHGPLKMVGENARTCHDRPDLEFEDRIWAMGLIDLWHVWLPLPSSTLTI